MWSGYLAWLADRLENGAEGHTQLTEGISYGKVVIIDIAMGDDVRDDHVLVGCQMRSCRLVCPRDEIEDD